MLNKLTSIVCNRTDCIHVLTFISVAPPVESTKPPTDTDMAVDEDEGRCFIYMC